jgi:hypothetical protein
VLDAWGATTGIGVTAALFAVLALVALVDREFWSRSPRLDA